MAPVSFGWPGPPHSIAPEPDSARRVRDGEPADIRDPAAYPILAVCITCGLPIRCERWLRSAWYHAEPEIRD